MAERTLSLVLPCFNEEANIEHTVRDVLQWMTKTKKKGEIIVVNDGSRDSSGDILKTLQKEISFLKVVTHEKNQGYGVAIRSGIDAATMDIAGFMDSDGQFHAEDLDMLLPHLDTYKFVTGRRQHRADSFVRNMFGKVLGAMNVLILFLWVRDVNCGMKVFERSLWSTVRPEYGVEKLFNTEMFLRLKKKKIPWMTVNIPHYPRLAGNPTGAKLYVIVRMFQELWALRRSVA